MKKVHLGDQIIENYDKAYVGHYQLGGYDIGCKSHDFFGDATAYYNQADRSEKEADQYVKRFGYHLELV